MIKRMEWQRFVQHPKPESQSEVLLIFSIALALFSFLGPITTKMLSRTPQFTEVTCKPGTEVVYLRMMPSSSINLVADQAIQKTRLPSIRLSDFKNRMDGNGVDNFNILYPKIANELASLSPGTTIRKTLNLKNLNHLWLIADTTKLPRDSDIVGACGKLTTNPATKRYRFFYADSIQAGSALGNN